MDALPKLDLSIDDTRLVEEWQRQPLLVLEWTGILADATNDADIAKAELEIAKAEAMREIKESPAEFGVTKATDTAVVAAVAEHPRVKIANKKYLACRHTQMQVSGAVAVLEDRRRALQKIVDLHGQDYWATPSAPPPRGVRPRRTKGADDE